MVFWVWFLRESQQFELIIIGYFGIELYPSFTTSTLELNSNRFLFFVHGINTLCEMGTQIFDA